MMDKGPRPHVSLVTDLQKRPDFHAAPFLGTYFLRSSNCTRETRLSTPMPGCARRLRS